MTLQPAIRSPSHPSAQPTPSAAQPPARRGELRATFALAHAGTHRLVVRWECVGPADAPVHVVLGGISAHRHLAAHALDESPGWWPAQVGEGRALDPARHALLSIDWLGADGTLDAPIATADQADALAAVLDALGIVRVEALVGASYGAMVGLALAARHPGRLARLVAISGAHRAHPDATAARVLQRRIVALGGGSAASLSLARGLAMLGYRSAEELASRFDAPPSIAGGVVRCASEDWLDACGARFAARFAPRAFLRLSESLDLHRVDPAAVRVPTTLVGVEEDRLVPIADLVALARAIGPHARLARIRSRYGHDAFLKEDRAVDAVLRAALRGAA